jgi:circadian clock protein KaiC
MSAADGVADAPFGRVPTGIGGLDEILHGGWPEHGVYLLKGGPGSGKTTLGLQYLLDGARRGETCLFVSLSQSTRMLRRIAASHGMSLEGIHVHAITPREILRQLRDKQDVFVTDEVELIDVGERIRDLIEDLRPSRLVFDSLNFIEMLATLPGRFEQELAALVELLGDEQTTGLFILSSDGPATADMVVDGTIQLEHLAQDFAGMRYRLTVQKVRGSDFQGGEHDFEIVRGGLVVYPRLALAELPARNRHDDARRFASGLHELDGMMGGPLPVRSSCLLVGPSGSGKTSLATRYAFQAAEDGRTVAYFLFEERRATMLDRSAELHIDLRPHIASERVRVLEVGGSSVLPGELATMIREHVDGGAEMIVIDSLSGYYQSLPDKRLLLAQTRDVIRYLGDRGVMLILALSQISEFGHALELDVSESVDVLVNLDFVASQGSLRKGVAVLKRRDGAHDTSMRELVIGGERGIEIGRQFGRFEGQMTGPPTIATAPDPGHARERRDDDA